MEDHPTVIPAEAGIQSRDKPGTSRPPCREAHLRGPRHQGWPAKKDRSRLGRAGPLKRYHHPAPLLFAVVTGSV